jgi:hypothetical protein
MYASELVTDYWQGLELTQERVANPSWDCIETAIRRLNGKEHTIATVRGEREAHMAIGGGKDGQYVVYATFDNLKFFTLASKWNAQTKIELVAGGQEGEYPDNIVVGVDRAIAAAKEFSEDGALNFALWWLEK